MMDRLVTVKSNPYGMEIHMNPDVPFDTLLESMKTKFQNSARFFRGAQMAVTVLDRKLTYLEEQTILELISDITGIDMPSTETDVISNLTCDDICVSVDLHILRP